MAPFLGEIFLFYRYIYVCIVPSSRVAVKRVEYDTVPRKRDPNTPGGG